MTSRVRQRRVGARLVLALVASIAAHGCRVTAPAADGAGGWLLIAPPNLYRDGAARMDERAPLWKWSRLAAFDNVAECRRFRTDRIATARGDEEWAVWSLSRCESAARAEGPRLTPDEESDGR